jgi:PAS domain S-box-containing protein
VIPVPRRDTAPDRLALIRDLLTSLPAAVAYLAGPDLVIDFANDAYGRLAGDRDVVGMPLRQALPELASQGVFDLIERIMETGEPIQGTETGVWVHRRSGRAGQVFVDFTYQPVRDADGAVAGVLLYAADVTVPVRDRDRLEALAGSLATSEERYRTLFETLP